MITDLVSRILLRMSGTPTRYTLFNSGSTSCASVSKFSKLVLLKRCTLSLLPNKAQRKNKTMIFHTPILVSVTCKIARGNLRRRNYATNKNFAKNLSVKLNWLRDVVPQLTTNCILVFKDFYLQQTQTWTHPNTRFARTLLESNHRISRAPLPTQTLLESFLRRGICSATWTAIRKKIRAKAAIWIFEDRREDRKATERTLKR